MKLVADPETAAWLATRPAMQGDAGNSTKSEAIHGFHVADVEKEAYDEAT